MPKSVIARAAAIVLRDGRVLLSRNLEDAFWSLPGGRVEPDERAEEALAREIAEELGVVGAKVGTLLWRLENDFAHAGRRYRETGFYHRVEIAAASCPLVRVVGDRHSWSGCSRLARSADKLGPGAVGAAGGPAG